MKIKGKKAHKKNASPSNKDKKSTATEPADLLVSEQATKETVTVPADVHATEVDSPALVEVQTAEKSPPAPVAAERRTITNDERRRLISLAAYFRAQRAGFGKTNPVDDWLLAEREVDAMIAGGASI